MFINHLLITPNQNFEHPYSKTETFNQIYQKIIKEWSKDLYTPKIILDKILDYLMLGINNSNRPNFTLGISLKEMKQLLNKDNYQYYSEFLNVIQGFKQDFSIYVTFCNANSFNDILYSLQGTTFINYAKGVFNSFKNNPGQECEIFTIKNNLNVIDPKYVFTKGCLIVINYKNISQSYLNNREYYETLIDHELNHYFDLLDLKAKYSIKAITKPKQIIKKVVQKAGYYFNTKDFFDHMFGVAEFNSMCSDVCNVISFYMINTFPKLSKEQWYYKWINMSTSKFLQSEQFKQLNEPLKKVLLFSFVQRISDKQRWKILKQHVRIQLNNPKRNIFKEGFIWLKELFNQI